jgi:membrane dipeptidase
VIVDGHLDLLIELTHRRAESRPFARHWLPQLERGGVGLQVCPIYAAGADGPDAALREGVRAVAAFHRALTEQAGEIVHVTAAGDLDRDGLRLLLSFEGVEPLGEDVELMDVFWQLGVRMVGLTWNSRNAFADGAGVEDDRGLSPLGEQLVDRLVELGAILDLAHASPRTYADVLERAPADTALLVSHAGCRAVHDHPRNLTDEQLRALADRGGVLGLMCLPLTVGSESPERLVDHVDHVVELVGIEHVGLGGDFIRQINRATGSRPITGGLLPPGMASDAALDDLEGPQDYPNLVAVLRRRGYENERLAAILGGNLLRLFRRGLPPDDR